MSHVATADSRWIEWAKRNPRTIERLDQVYEAWFAVTRTELNRVMLQSVPRTATVLEIGTSNGAQLQGLERLGFADMAGLDSCAEAMKANPYSTTVADVRDLSGFDDRSYDVVMTSGTLMHLDPEDGGPRAVREIARVAAGWLYITEYWAPRTDKQVIGEACPPFWCQDWSQVFAPLGWHANKLLIVASHRSTAPLWMALLQRPGT